MPCLLNSSVIFTFSRSSQIGKVKRFLYITKYFNFFWNIIHLILPVGLKRISHYVNSDILLAEFLFPDLAIRNQIYPIYRFILPTKKLKFFLCVNAFRSNGKVIDVDGESANNIEIKNTIISSYQIDNVVCKQTL